MGEQDENLDRVSARIGWAILQFYFECSQRGTVCFHADELRRFVRARVGEIAPGSPDRVMRDLRAKGQLNYRVLSRRDSLYEIKLKLSQMDLKFD